MKSDISQYFELLDVYLWESQLKRESSFSLMEDAECSVFEFMHQIESQEFETVDEAGLAATILRTTVAVGTRNVDSTTRDQDECKVFHSLISKFVVDAKLISDVPQDAKDAFATKNAIYIVWPYWRELVSNTFRAASLPAPIIPLYSHPSISTQTQAE